MANDYFGSKDTDLLDAVLQSDGLNHDEKEAFTDMAIKFDVKPCRACLTPKQRSWLEAVASRLDVAPPAANLASKVPVGRPVPTFDAFLAGPKPVRR